MISYATSDFVKDETLLKAILKPVIEIQIQIWVSTMNARMDSDQ
jgi:hypothetical protein